MLTFPHYPRLRCGLLAMLTLGLGLSLSTAAPGFFNVPIGAQEATKSKRFAVNSETGRAWVEVDTDAQERDTKPYHRIFVPGLSYKAENREVIFHAEGHSVVCAKVMESGWLFKNQTVHATGACELTRKSAKIPMNGGFSVEVLERFAVRFEPLPHLKQVDARPAKNNAYTAWPQTQHAR